MRDKSATSHETSIDIPGEEIDGPMILWLGDEKEAALTNYFQEHLDSEPGWYWIISFLTPRGPFDTSKEAYDDFNDYWSCK